FGSSIETGHDEREFILRPGRPKQAWDRRQAPWRLSRKASNEPADVLAKRIGARAHAEYAVIEDSDVIRNALHIIEQVSRKKNRPLAVAREVDHGFEQGPASGGIQTGGRVVEHQ